MMLQVAELLAGLSPPPSPNFPPRAPAQRLGTAKRSTQQSPTSKISLRHKPQHSSPPGRTVPLNPKHPSIIQPRIAPSVTSNRQVQVPHQECDNHETQTGDTITRVSNKQP